MVDNELFDLRSDTVTRPSAAMRQAMAQAEVGDDVYGEDPTVTTLERRTAELLGKERSLFVPSGTMANQLALLAQTRPGDEVVIGEGAHCAWYESGAAAAWSGVQFAVAGAGGLFDANELEEAIKPDAYYLPRTSLVALENTHNRSGGRVFPMVAVEGIAAVARRRGLALHLDGARIWNAAVAMSKPASELCAPFDTVSVCYSKGLGAPVGSALAGSQQLIARAHRFRKMLGGGMRQAGILAAGALHALEHNRQRIAEDHVAARAIAEIIAGTKGARCDAARVETNVVMIELERASSEAVIDAARRRGVLIGPLAKHRLRAVTHLDIPLERARRAAERLAEAIEAAERGAET
jgi:threonine aldolase